MTTYKESGVDIYEGDKASKIAYNAAQATFTSRVKRIGTPLLSEGGFSGLLDMGEYYLVQNDDGVGTKSILAEKTGIFDTLGFDLISMVADDAICVGAEVISVSNTMDVDKVDSKKIEQMMSGLQKAAIQQEIVIPGGEIAELSELVNGYVWNATAIGVVEKEKVIDGSSIEIDDKIITLYSPGFRSNGLSLVRHILRESFGENYEKEPFGKSTYAKAALIPSTIYHNAILKIHGRYREEKKADIKGIAHITGGGIPNNLRRILKKKNLGAHLSNIFKPDNIVREIQKLGNVNDKEAYETWNMGNGMMIITNDDELIIKSLEESGIQARVAGKITKESDIIIDNGENQLQWHK